MKFNKHLTPWGSADQVSAIGIGILSVQTPGHGGIFVPDELLTLMPAALRNSNQYSGTGSNWFEEDVEWALVCAAFPHLFPVRSCFYALATIESYANAEPGEYFHGAAQWLNVPWAAQENLKSRAALHGTAPQQGEIAF